MNAPRFSSRLRQQGMVTVIVAIFLITAVFFALGQTLSITGSNSIDSEHQMDSVAALFLAESGVERGQSILNSDPIRTNTLCTGIGDGSSSYALGRGTVTSIATSTPATCDSSGGNPCVSCLIQSTGQVGSAFRTIQANMNLISANGKACNTTGGKNCSNPVLKLENTNTYASVAVFNLAYDRQGQTINGACTGTGCAVQWLVRAKQTSADMGNSVTIAAGASYPITITLPSDNYAFVGALFPGSSAAGPAILGSYWDQQSNGNGNTVGKSGTNGGFTNNGVATGASTAIAPVDDNSTTQTSTKWCYGGDTLIWGFGGTGSSTSDQISNVLFNTSGTPAQNIVLQPIAKYPVAGSTDVPSTQDIYAQIFYARNPNLSAKANVTAGSFVVNEAYVIKTLGSTSFTSIGAASNTVNTAFVATSVGSGTGTATPLNPFAANASSYKGNGTGAIGAKWTGGSNSTCTIAAGGNCVTVVASTWSGVGNSTSAGTTTLTVGTVPSTPIYPGATITHVGGGLTGSPYITRQLTSTEAGNALAGRGTYELSVSQASTTSAGNWTATNSILIVGNFAGVAGYAYPQQIISPQITQNDLSPTIISGAGDLVTSTGPGGTNPQITNAIIASQLTSNETGGMAGGLGGRGTYSLIAGSAVAASSSRTWTTSSNILNVSNCIICFIENGNAIITGFITNKTISSQLGSLLPGDGGTRQAEVTQGVGRYVLSSSGNPALPTTIASANTLRVYSGTDPATAPGTTIYLPSTQSMPAVTTPNTRIAIAAGTGVFAANTTVTAVAVPNAATNSFTVSSAPTTALNVAIICGGTCAFFNNPSNVASITNFTFSTTNSNYWSSAFLCLVGVDVAPPSVVTNPNAVPTSWQEVVK